jgi:regulator of sigma E protease
MVRRLDSPEKERVRVTVQRVDEADTTVTTHALLLPRLEGVDAIAEAAPHEPVPVSIEQLGLTFEPLQWSTVTGMIRNSPGQEISVTVLRQGEQLTKRMTPRTEMDDDFNPNTGELEKQPIPRIGVTPKQIYRRLAPLAAMRAGFAETALIGEAVVMGLAEMIAGEARPQVMSIVKIAVEIQEQTYQGWYWVLRIGGFISFIIGFLNILPFPPFDGWRLVYLGYEGVIGRAPDRKKEALINLVGFAVVMFAFVILVLKDVMDLVANRAVR